MRVEFEVVSEDGLSGEVWGFFVNYPDELWVDTYSRVTRGTKRQKWKTEGFWSRLRNRNATILKEDVPVTPEVLAKGKMAYLDLLEKTVTLGFQK